MEFTGKINGIGIDYNSQKFTLSLVANENIAAEYECLKDCEKVRVTVKKYRNKRSIDANAYYWRLLTELSEVLKISKPCAHNIMLRKYGQSVKIDGAKAYCRIPDTEEAEETALEATTFHIRPTSQVVEGNDGINYRTYVMLRGSSEYDSKEMSELIDGLVSDCKQAGIETATPEELTRMKREWGVNI